MGFRWVFERFFNCVIMDANILTCYRMSVNILLRKYVLLRSVQPVTINGAYAPYLHTALICFPNRT